MWDNVCVFRETVLLQCKPLALASSYLYLNRLSWGRSWHLKVNVGIPREESQKSRISSGKRCFVNNYQPPDNLARWLIWYVIWGEKKSLEYVCKKLMKMNSILNVKEGVEYFLLKWKFWSSCSALQGLQIRSNSFKCGWGRWSASRIWRGILCKSDH